MVEETKCAQESAALVKNEKPPMLFRVKTAIKRNYTGWLFIMPTVLGILFFTLYPMVASLVYSFFDYNVVDPPHNFGFQNYIRPFTEGWPEFSKSLQVTFVYSIVSIPLNMVLSFAPCAHAQPKGKRNAVFPVALLFTGNYPQRRQRLAVARYYAAERGNHERHIRSRRSARKQIFHG